MNKKKILFIAHDASRSGAPIVLLSFLNWLKRTGNAEFDVLLLEDGPLKNDFDKIANTYLIPGEYKYTIINKIRRRLHPELLQEYKISEVVRKLSKTKYDIVFGNTIVTLPWLLRFKKVSDIKAICSIHELSNVIEYYFKKAFVTQELQKVDLVIAGSEAVKKNLVEEFKTPQEKIKVVHAFIDTHVNVLKDRNLLRQELSIKQNELIIGGMGLFQLRKGVDLIIPLARELKNKYNLSFKFIWVGGSASDNSIQIFKRDAIKCGVEKHVLFIENTPNPDDYLNLFDIFVLLSREDPFPLVLLSSANMEKAIIAFDGSGGAEELLRDGAGFLAPYLNVQEMAKIISGLYYNRSMVEETGKKAKDKVKKEFSADVIPNRLFEILEGV